MTRLVLVIAVVLGVLVGPHASPAVAAEKATVALRCGTGDFVMTTQYLMRPSGGFAVPHQQLTIAGRAVALDDARTAAFVGDGLSGRRSLVASWACVRAATGRQFVSLGYICADRIKADTLCGGQREWFRLVDDRGRRLDRGFARQGRQYDRLYARLGLTKVMAAGVAMTDTLPN